MRNLEALPFFTVERIDPAAGNWRSPLTDEVLREAHAVSRPIPVSVESAQVRPDSDGVPRAVRTGLIARDGIAGALRTGDVGRAILGIATVPPTVVEGALVRMKGHPSHGPSEELVFVATNEAGQLPTDRLQFGSGASELDHQEIADAAIDAVQITTTYHLSRNQID